MDKRPFLRSSLLFVLALILLFTTCQDTDKPKEQDHRSHTAISAEGSILATDCEFVDPTPEESARHYAGQYRFSSDWFTPHIPAWRGAVGHLRGKPKISYLEIGLYEGRSAIWVLENILTDPSAHLTGIDIFPGNVKQRWLHNLAQTGRSSQATTLTGYSQKILRQLPSLSFDIIYIDGSHTGYDVLADAVLAWDLLKPGGVLIFDDYRWRRGKELPADLKPGPAIDSFITMYRDFLTVIHRCYQLMLVKKQNPCAGEEHCSPIGPYLYLWQKRALLSRSGVIQISNEEHSFIMTILRSRKPGRTDYHIPSDLLESKKFKDFIARLGLELILPAPPEIQRLREFFGPVRYSKGNEELFIRDYFKDMWDGVFVDVGGGNFCEHSTSLFLEQHLSWNGIVIDSSESIEQRLRKRRPNTPFYDLSPFLPEGHRATGSQTENTASSFDPTPSFRLDELLARNNLDHIDFLNVALPEAWKVCFSGLDLKKYNPQLICVRADESHQNEIEKYLTDNGYVLIDEYSRLDPHNHYFCPKRGG
jgi:SAM-dependent methyltransferase